MSSGVVLTNVAGVFSYSNDISSGNGWSIDLESGTSAPLLLFGLYTSIPANTAIASVFGSKFSFQGKVRIGIDVDKNTLSVDCLDTNSNISSLLDPNNVFILLNSGMTTDSVSFVTDGPYTGLVEAFEIVSGNDGLKDIDLITVASIPAPIFAATGYSAVWFRVYGYAPGDNYQISTAVTNGGQLIGG